MDQQRDEKDKTGNNTYRTKKRKRYNSNKKVSYRWIRVIVLWTFLFSIALSFISSTLLNKVNLVLAFIILIFIISLGIIFDIIGIAVASASEAPFHSMAANKVIGSKQAVKLIRNAEKVSSFCNDVVGDIAGIISGATSAAIISQLVLVHPVFKTVNMGLLLTALVAALTVGGKAMGKSIAISKSKDIIYRVGVVIYYFDKAFGRK